MQATAMGEGVGIENRYRPCPSPFSARITPIRANISAAGFRGVDQVLDRDLPAFLLLHVFRQLHDVIGGLLQRREPGSAAQAYRLIERRRPRHFRPSAQVVKPWSNFPES
jgi:hypothetical protein